jgi:single stranded DNA-binding protein
MYGAAKFHVVGTAAGDAEHTTLSNRTERCTISVAVNVPQKQQDGSYVEKTTWFRFAFFGKAAERKTLDWVQKGTPVYVEGTIQGYTQEVGDGKKFTMFNFRPDVMRPLGQRPRDGGEEQPARAPRQSGGGGNEDPGFPVDDDLPDAFS